MNKHFGDTTRIQSCLGKMGAGDEAARDELLGHVQRRLGQLAAKMLQGFPNVAKQIEADDLVQQANIRLMTALKSVHPQTAEEFIGLAARQIRWELLDLASKVATNPHRPPGGNSEDAPDPPAKTSGPRTLAQWTEFHEKIEQLPPEQRRLFDLLFYNGSTVAQAAAELGISENTVRKNWLKARLSLHAAIAK